MHFFHVFDFFEVFLAYFKPQRYSARLLYVSKNTIFVQEKNEVGDFQFVFHFLNKNMFWYVYTKLKIFRLQLYLRANVLKAGFF